MTRPGHEAFRKSNVVRRSFKSIIQRANAKAHKEAREAGGTPVLLPDIRFHDLRHTAATLMLSMGTQPKVVAERLGHAKTDLVNNVYGHVLPTMQAEARP